MRSTICKLLCRYIFPCIYFKKLLFILQVPKNVFKWQRINWINNGIKIHIPIHDVHDSNVRCLFLLRKEIYGSLSRIIWIQILYDYVINCICSTIFVYLKIVIINRVKICKIKCILYCNILWRIELYINVQS